MGAAHGCKPRRAAMPGPAACLALGLVLGLTCHLPLKGLVGQHAAAVTGGLQLQVPAACAPAATPSSSPGAAFASFIYPTWPATDLKPAVSLGR